MGRGSRDTQLPTGTITFLFTDVERSTRAIAELGDEPYADLLEEQRSILRRAIGEHDGVEVSTEGDAFFVAFTTAGDAVAAAMDAQRQLAERSSLRVRMGIHTGEAIVRSDDYVGHDVHIAKRVQEAAHGGQILLSRTAADLVGSRVPLKELGSYRLKDVDDPAELFQVVDAGAPEQFPHPRAPRATRHNLPAHRTMFIGRVREVERVSALLAKGRMVTITGVGGSGKTRLAVEVGASMLPRWRDGVFFCDLVPVSDPSMLIGLVASVTHIHSQAAGAAAPLALDALLAGLATFDALLIFDNCEHLIEGCADLVDSVLGSCPNISILATSREPLGVDGEHVFALRSLGLPDGGSDGAESIDLFVDRASAVRDDFALTDANRSSVADICRRLDGMPLAIELAAAQVAHLSAREIGERLDNRFELLTGGRRRVQRQQTLAAAVDWSYDLLTNEERDVLCRVAVFPASFTAEAASALFPQRSASVLPALKALVEKSLVNVEDGSETRYRLLETIRFYAQEKLVSRNEADVVRTRHRDWLLEALNRQPITRFDPADMERGRLIEHDLAAALAWSKREGRYDLVAELMNRSMNAWTINMADSLRWYDEALEHAAELPNDVQSQLCTGRAWLGMALVDPVIGRTASFAARAIELASSDDVPYLPDAYGILSLSRSFEGVLYRTDVSEAVRALGERGLEIANTPLDRAACVFCYGLALINVGDLDRAVDVFEETLVRLETIAPPTVTSNLSLLHHVRGDHDRARRFAELARDEAISSGSGEWQLVFSLPLAVCLAVDGRHEQALAGIEADLAVPGASSVPAALTATVTTLGALAVLRNDWEVASVLLSAARAAFDRAEIRGPTDLMLYSHYVPHVRAALDPDTARSLRTQGRNMRLDEALRRGLQRT